MATDAQIRAAQAFYNAGFRGDALTAMVAISGRETGGTYAPDAWNGNTGTGDQSAGLVQINMIGNLGVERAKIMQSLGIPASTVGEAIQSLKNPDYNAKMAYYLSGGGADLSPWGGYKNEPNLYSTNVDLAHSIVQSAGYDAGNVDNLRPLQTTVGVQLGQSSGSSAGQPAQAGGSAVSDPYATQKSDLSKQILDMLQNQPDSSDASAVYAWNIKFQALTKGLDVLNTISPTPTTTSTPLGTNQTGSQTQTTFNPADIPQQSFQNAISRAGLDISYDNANLANATASIDRFLSGAQESRARAQLNLSGIEDLIKYGTAPGKSSFSLADLGAGFAASAKNMGIDPNAGFLNYSGTVRVDPALDMANYDRQFGVQGNIPTIPIGITNPSSFPQVPNLPNVGTTTTQTSSGSTIPIGASAGLDTTGPGTYIPPMPYGGGPSPAVDPYGVSGGSVLPPGAGGEWWK